MKNLNWNSARNLAIGLPGIIAKKYLRAKLVTKGIKQLAYYTEQCPDSL